jgi:hypothetical protein
MSTGKKILPSCPERNPKFNEVKFEVIEEIKKLL